MLMGFLLGVRTDELPSTSHGWRGKKLIRIKIPPAVLVETAWGVGVR
jgi:hypothetical protein